MKTTRKDELIAVAQEYRGKPFFSTPLDARLKNDWVEIRHQESHELEPHWDQVVNTQQLKSLIDHYTAKSDTKEAQRLSKLLGTLEHKDCPGRPPVPFEMANAVTALKLAAECGGELDRQQYRKAHEGLERLREQIIDYDNSLNAREVAPTGADYNALMSLLALP